ncbi:LAMI_0H15808g1_1 [Lachancea mirantina]|uniref:LAMI_0H15808g1_1 n=1 Tax=Lachancea mirantina TaxID=1230905 RepID=A0A1G4KIU1_9SACH|nr:LAMI_0H15808g1_1 [Lachancea mirantina]
MGSENDSDESRPFLVPIDKDRLQDPTSDIAGFVASELEQQEERLVDHEQEGYGALPSESGPENTQFSFYRTQLIMTSMYLGIFLAALDNTILSTLLTHIASEFDDLPRISWIVTAYLLASATFQPLYGKISDIFGRKPLLLFSNAAFGIGCLICGVSHNLWWLTLGRFVSGIGGGGLSSMASITTSDIVPLRNRALYQGFCNFFFGLGTACGGLVGGWFTEHAGGWRISFLAQVPACVFSCVLIISYLNLPQDRVRRQNGHWRKKLLRVDWTGSFTLVSFLFSFTLATSLGGKELPYGSLGFALLGAAIVMFGGLFAYVELKITKDPILPIGFLRDRSILGSSLANWFCTMGMLTTSFYLPVYFASVLGMGPTDVGKRSIPSFFSIAFGSLGVGYYMKRTGRYYKFLLAFCGVALVGQLQINLITPSIAVWRQYTLLVVPGFGVSVLITVTLLAMIAAVPHEHQAATTSISYAFRTTGCTLGISIGAAIFQKSLASLLNDKVMRFASEGHSKEELMKIIRNASHSSEWVHESAPEFVRATLLECYHYACKSTFKFCMACMVLASLSCSIIKEYKLHTSMKRDN